MNQAFIMDMVHNNPGEAPFETAYNDPQFCADAGFNAKSYFLFDSPTLAIEWNSVAEDIFPVGSEECSWRESKAAHIRDQHSRCRRAGLQIYAQADMVLFPKNLITAYGIEDCFGDPQNVTVIELIQKQIAESFEQFPELDGFVFRIGETYLHDAPHHRGSILNKDDTENTIIPLISLLRDEICIKHNKKRLFCKKCA